MKKKLIALLLLAVFVLAGCAAHVHVVGEGAQGTEVVTARSGTYSLVRQRSIGWIHAPWPQEPTTTQSRRERVLSTFLSGASGPSASSLRVR